MFGDVAFAQSPFASQGGSTTAAAIAEGAGTTDDSVAVFGIFVELNESGGASDASSIVRNTYSELSDSVNIEEITLSQAFYNALQEEGSEISSAIFDSTQDSNIHVTGIQMTLGISSVLIWGDIPDAQVPDWVLIPT